MTEAQVTALTSAVDFGNTIGVIGTIGTAAIGIFLAITGFNIVKSMVKGAR